MATKKFTLAELSVTRQTTPNTPTGAELKNLTTYLKPLLERIYNEVGPFKVVSAYRSMATQAALKRAGKPVAPKKSFHEAGLAADIVPLKGDLRDFYQKIFEKPWAKKLVGELAIKLEEGQNAIHLSAQAPGTKGFTPLALTRDPATDKVAYLPLTAELRKKIFRPSVAIGGGTAILLIALGVWFLTRKKEGAASPPAAA